MTRRLECRHAIQHRGKAPYCFSHAASDGVQTGTFDHLFELALPVTPRDSDVVRCDASVSYFRISIIRRKHKSRSDRLEQEVLQRQQT